jgi:hypothetical protein
MKKAIWNALLTTLGLAPAIAQKQPPLHTFDTNTTYNLFGNECCGIGDADGDGYADVAVSAYYDSWVRVYSGADGKLSYLLLGAPLDGKTFGYAMDGAGDVDGDGRPDFVVGAHGSSQNGIGSGRAAVYSGSDGTLLREVLGPAPSIWFGFSVGGAGDVNGDGLGDWIAGAPYDDTAAPDAGRAYVYSGKDNALLFAFSGVGAMDHFGFSVDGAGDVDADGHADLVVGAEWETVGSQISAGTARVFSGRDGQVLHLWSGGWSSSYGRSVSGAGDVDGDGHADVIVGAHEHHANGQVRAGRVEVRSGKTGSLLYLYEGTKTEEHVGREVSEAGDVDGDGLADFQYSAVWSGVNYVRVLSGATGKELARFDGQPTLGLGLGASGDVNRDGLGDLIVGAPQVNPADGEAYVYLGSLGILGTTYCTPAVPNSTGSPAELFASGSAAVVQNELRLTAQHLPPNRAGLFLVGSQSSFLANPGGSKGNLCVGGALGRFSAQPIHSGPSGTASLSVDLTTMSGLAPVLAGSTWYFQAWHQDDDPQPTSNLSDAVSVTFH